MRLKELRKERNLTQTEVANGIGTGQSNVRRWEIGEVLPSSDYVIKLADFFQVSADFLLGRSDDLGNVSIQSNAPALTADEKEILRLYRSFSPPLQDLARNAFRAWANQPSSPAKK